jgi:hypothetical protein
MAFDQLPRPSGCTDGQSRQPPPVMKTGVGESLYSRHWEEKKDRSQNRCLIDPRLAPDWARVSVCGPDRVNSALPYPAGAWRGPAAPRPSPRRLHHGFTTTRTTMAISSSVGTSLAMR